jgi:hypothetical protein
MYKLPVYFNPQTQQYVHLHKTHPSVIQQQQRQQQQQQQQIHKKYSHVHQQEYLRSQQLHGHINVVPIHKVQSGHTRLDKRDEEMQNIQMYGDPEMTNYSSYQYNKYNLSNMRNAELLKSKEHNNIYTPKINRPDELLNDLKNNKYTNGRKKMRIPDGANLDDTYAPFSVKNSDDQNIKKSFGEMIPNLRSINFEKIQTQKNNRRGNFASVQDNIL